MVRMVAVNRNFCPTRGAQQGAQQNSAATSGIVKKDTAQSGGHLLAKHSILVLGRGFGQGAERPCHRVDTPMSPTGTAWRLFAKLWPRRPPPAALEAKKSRMAKLTWAHGESGDARRRHPPQGMKPGMQVSILRPIGCRPQRGAGLERGICEAAPTATPKPPRRPWMARGTRRPP